MFRKIRRLSELSPAEAILLPLLTLVSLGTAVGLRFGTLPSVTRAIRPLRRLGAVAKRLSPSRLFAVADLAARITRGRNRCLPRSLLLFGLLGGPGDPVELRVGVQRESARFTGHAWIQRGSEVLGDPPGEVDRFSEIVRITAD